MSTKRMCELLAGFVSWGRDGDSADIGAGLVPKEGREGKGRDRPGPGAFTHAAFHPREQTHFDGGIRGFLGRSGLLGIF